MPLFVSFAMVSHGYFGLRHAVVGVYNKCNLIVLDSKAAFVVLATPVAWAVAVIILR